MQNLQRQMSWVSRVQKTIVISVVVALIAFYFFAYRPLVARQSEVLTLTAAHRIELLANQSKSSERQIIAAKNERLREQLDLVKKPSKQQELPDLIKELTAFGQESSLKKFNYTVAGMPSRGDLFCELPIAITFEGDFTNVFGFLQRTEAMQRLVRIRSITVKNKGNDGQVEAQLALNVYFSAE